MNLKDFLDKKRNALLEEEQKQAALERQRLEAEAQQERQRKKAGAQRLADCTVEPHPLCGRDASLLDDYVLAQLVLWKAGEAPYTEGKLLRLFAIALGMPLEHFADLQVEASLYDEESNREELVKVCGELKEPEEVICFLCDLVKLHGEKYVLEGDFLDLWRSVSMGLFQKSSEETALLEKFCVRIAKGERRKFGGDFGKIPQKLVRYYLSQYALLNGQYLVIDLSGGANASQYPVRSTDKPPELWEDACRTTELWLKRIPAGCFTMGSPQNELGRKDDETQHRMMLTKDYYIGVFPCTQRQYELVMGNNPSCFKGKEHRPVETVSYDTLRGTDKGSEWPSGSGVDGNSFFGRLQERTGLVLDLPTEVEWEYACRAGTTTALNSGKNLTATLCCCLNLVEVGWYEENSDKTTHPVGERKPNAWGLYDMHGSVWEWCLDWYGNYPGGAVTDPHGAQTLEIKGTDSITNSPGEAVTDPHGVQTGEERVIRGGSWNKRARYCRSAARYCYNSSSCCNALGFRIALRS